MDQNSLPRTNFAVLQEYDVQLLRLGMLAEKYFTDDPNTCLLKLRQFGEVMALQIASRVGQYESLEETQFELVRRLEYQGYLPREISQLFHEIRRSGNVANHSMEGDRYSALSVLKMAWQIGVWFHKSVSDPSYKSEPFIPPIAPEEEKLELKDELQRLATELEEYQKSHKQVEIQLQVMAEKLLVSQDKKAFWEQLVTDVEEEKEALRERLLDLQTSAALKPAHSIDNFKKAANEAASDIRLDEADTRKLIDHQLRQAGWHVDTINLRYSKGTRPEKGKNIAIAEWPTASGPADYVLFLGLKPAATVEAKRKNIDVSAALVQAKRYSRDFQLTKNMGSPGGAWDDYQVPFAFSSNGRSYLRQLETKSGIWFADLRRPDYLSHALDGWYTPEGLSKLLKVDAAKSFKQLETETFDYGFTLRYYQKDAIRAIEVGIEQGHREMLVAMATGTGKTKTSIALLYRLLKVQRFNRVLFLVDRTALGEQAANAFKDTRMESLQAFADVFGIQEIDEQETDTETSVHIATVQGMVRKLMYPNEGKNPPTVDQYDFIVVDECHRGYLLDRELSDEELSFRNQTDYISKYRRVLDYFDSVKIGLTATPALHTTEIFGLPVYSYSYRDAVIDGYLIDHEPPIQITTKLSEEGIVWESGAEVQVYNPKSNEIEFYTAPDEIKMDVEDFNRKVITKEFNRVVCEYLAREIDPYSPQKTLIFSVRNSHADLVVSELKKAFKKVYGSIEDDAIVKITGAADKPLQLIRQFKNERNPIIVVTVDMLTTGIDVPEICNLVFLRRVNSRILFDQMLGRGTRLCDEIGKETFRVFDAVKLYEALKDLTAMKPVIANPKISFSQLIDEIINLAGEEEQAVALDQFIAKLQRKKRRISSKAERDFETVVGVSPEEFIDKLQEMPFEKIADWFVDNPQLGEILDRKIENQKPMLISEHADQLHSVQRGYGQATKPEDYLEEFSEFIKTNRDTIPALMTVLTRPRDLTRKQLRELAIELDRAGFSETSLDTAWREMTNQDIAARIIGYIRHIATGDQLVPYEQRVDWALQQMLAARNWTTPQRQWLHKIAAQTNANVIVDRDALDDPDLIFKREGGGINRLDRLFEGNLFDTLRNFNEMLWAPRDVD